MGNESIIDDIVGKVQSKLVKEQPKKTTFVPDEDAVIEHIWMSEDHSQIKENTVTKRDPRVDTGILKDRIAEKIAKLNSNSA